MNLEVFLQCCPYILALLGGMYAYMALYVIVGMFFTKHFAPAKKYHRYGIIIAARNEENVIGQLLDSIRAQDYPDEFVTTFVVADNCSDDTARIAREHGAVCYERFDSLHCTKGYAMQFLFRQIFRDYGRDTFEGFLMLDADNLLKEDYISRMNDAFDSGEKIITSYRNTKNLSHSCIAASYAFHWMRTCRCENRAKSILHTACRIQGTGFLFASELAADGWNYTNLTEDRSFCADAVAKGYRISYQDRAEFYDEQPEHLSIAFRQRKRWAKGHLQAFAAFGPALLTQMVQVLFSKERKSLPVRLRDAFTCYDMFAITLPKALITVCVKALELCACMGLILLYDHNPHVLTVLLGGFALSFLKSCLSNVLTAAYLLFTEKKRLPQLSAGRMILYCLTFPIFDILGKITYCMATVSKVEWKPIPHNAVLVRTT
jgi:cellulose synthase/poly-beta-1,6-N-acetylglucosamine synthase-like glycosyltransferase